MQVIYSYIPKTNHVSRIYTFAAVLYLEFILHVISLPPRNIFCICNNTYYYYYYYLFHLFVPFKSAVLSSSYVYTLNFGGINAELHIVSMFVIVDLYKTLYSYMCK
jgi:hypothetical protein